MTHIGSKGEILFVDDDSIQNMLNTRLLEFCGILNDKLAFTDPIEAIDYIKSNPNKACCIFLDLNMPELNGWEFLDRMGDFRHIPIFILTSSISIVDSTKAEEYEQVKEFIIKPLTAAMVENLKKDYGIGKVI